MHQKRWFIVYGKVQGVMFRQTFIRGAQKRDIKAGATNDSQHPNKVSCVIIGPVEKLDSFIQELSKMLPLNSWGAQITELEVLEQENIPFADHQITTENVDQFNWNPNIEMYL